jgi:hypothetical protein
MDGFSHLCLSYRNQLRPFLEMLKQKKTYLKKVEWLALVQKTEKNISNTPDQYLTGLERKDIIERAIHHVFDEFLTELEITQRW